MTLPNDVNPVHSIYLHDYESLVFYAFVFCNVFYVLVLLVLLLSLLIQISNSFMFTYGVLALIN